MGERLTSVFLKPGERYVTQRATEVSTFLGAGISVTLFHQDAEVGGICHASLPCRSADSTTGNEDPRYVDSAVRMLLQDVRNLGVDPHAMEISLFGGTNMIGPPHAMSDRPPVGNQNIIAADRILKEEGLRIAASDIGGAVFRRLTFNTGTGDVLVRHIAPDDMIFRVGNRRIDFVI